jgi:uncharacterized protein YjiS (DUF1127 family)
LKQKGRFREIRQKIKGPMMTPSRDAIPAPRVREDTDMTNYSYNTQAAVATPQVNVDGREFARTVQRFASNIFATVLEWQERARQRHRLAELDDRMLKDIGLTRADVTREVEKPFWIL